MVFEPRHYQRVYPLACLRYNYAAHYDERGSLAQLVEQRPEEPCVPSSSLGGATKVKPPKKFGGFTLVSIFPDPNRKAVQLSEQRTEEQKSKIFAIWEEFYDFLSNRSLSRVNSLLIQSCMG